MEVVLSPPTPDALSALIENEVRSARQLVISSPEQYAGAAEVLKRIKANAKALDDNRKAITKPLDDAKKKVMDLFRVPLEQLEQAEKKIKNGLVAYAREQERVRAEQQARLRAAQQAEEARLRVKAAKAQAEAEEKARELVRQASAAQAEGDAKTAAKLTVRAATTLERAEHKAGELLQQAESVPVAVVPNTTVPKVAGLRSAGLWKARVTDASVVPREYLVVNESALNAIARATKGAINVPGVEFYEETSIGSTRE